MANIIFYAFLLISIFGISQINASTHHKESRMKRQVSGADPYAYKNRYLDAIPGAYEGTYHKTSGNVNIQAKSAYDAGPGTAYVKETEGTIVYDGNGGPGQTDYKTNIKYIPSGRIDKTVDRVYTEGDKVNGDIPIADAKKNAGTNLNINPELLTLFVTLLASLTTYIRRIKQ